MSGGLSGAAAFSAPSSPGGAFGGCGAPSGFASSSGDLAPETFKPAAQIKLASRCVPDGGASIVYCSSLTPPAPRQSRPSRRRARDAPPPPPPPRRAAPARRPRPNRRLGQAFPPPPPPPPPLELPPPEQPQSPQPPAADGPKVGWRKAADAQRRLSAVCTGRTKLAGKAPVLFNLRSLLSAVSTQPFHHSPVLLVTTIRSPATKIRSPGAGRRVSAAAAARR